MMKKMIAILLTILLVGCSSTSWVTVSDSQDYEFYRNGERVCESTQSCLIKSSSGDEMVLEARKGDVVYGHLLVARENSKRGHSDNHSLRTINGGFKLLKDMSGMVSTPFGVFLFMAAGVVVLPVTIIMAVMPDDIGKLPANMTIPVGPSENALVPFPWDQPAAD